jgi:hypothetical protein
MNALIYALKLLEIIKMALGAGLSADPYIEAGEAVLQAAADAGVDITDDQILDLDATRHALEQQIRDAAAS